MDPRTTDEQFHRRVVLGSCARPHFLNSLFSQSLWLSTTERARHHSVRVYCKALCERTQHCLPTTSPPPPSPQHCQRLHVASVCTPCCVLVRVGGSSCAKFETGQTVESTSPNISQFRDRRSVAQQCWIRLHRSSNIFTATHAHYTLSLRSYVSFPR